jgi:hypothetical protein
MNNFETTGGIAGPDLDELWRRVEHAVDTVPCCYDDARKMVGYPDEPAEQTSVVTHAPMVAQQASRNVRHHSGIGPQYGEESAVGYNLNATGDVVFPRLSAEQAARNQVAIDGIRAMLTQHTS